MQASQFAAIIDHTFLLTDADGVSVEQQKQEIEKLTEQALAYGAFSVCVRPSMVGFVHNRLAGSKRKLKITSVIGFPVGEQWSTEQKITELLQARSDGADEFDMVLNVAAVNAGKWDEALKDVEAVSEAAGEQVLKVIFENAYLREKPLAWQKVAELLLASGAPRFLKTSTGFAKPPPGVAIGATLDDVKGMYAVAKGRLGIKPAGGVADLEAAQRFFAAAGSPVTADGQIDPMLFRIGSSSLLPALLSKSAGETSGY